MLEELRIRGLGVIEDAVVELAPGLTVLTGETGAGKTMVVNGLALLLGARAETGRLRSGGANAVLECRLRVDPAGPTAARAVEAGALLEGDVLLVTRTLTADGRSRASVGGAAVPVGVLAELTADLVAMHGQFDSTALLRPAVQRAALDRYAGELVTGPLRRYAREHERLRALDEALDETAGGDGEVARELDLLRSDLAEVSAAAPVHGEDEALAAEVDRLAHAEALLRAAGTAHGLLAGDLPDDDGGPAADRIAAGRRVLEQEARHDPALAGLAQRVAELSHLVADVASELAVYAASVESDPVRLAAAQERQAVLAALVRRHGPDLASVRSWAATADARVSQLEGLADRRAELAAQRRHVLDALGRAAAELTQARTAAGERFAAAVTGELADLALPHARLTVAVRPTRATGEPAYGPTGADTVEMLLAPHPGAGPRPVAKGASGGELSRVMLAVEVVLAGADPVGTMVFDEVDAGIGGRAAAEVGRRLAALARTAQVLVVTHLPQVAAFADRHLRVEKSSDGTVTHAGVTTLDDAGRVVELSRMLAGLEGSTLARAHAEELLAAATATKGDPRADPRRPAVLAD